MNDEFGRQIAASGGHDRRADGKLAAQPDTMLELFAAEDLQAPQRRNGGVESSCGGADACIRSQRGGVVHDHADHLPVLSPARRYTPARSPSPLQPPTAFPCPALAPG